MKRDITFKRGTYQIVPDANFNFQLNRVIMWDGGDAEEILREAKGIADSKSWVQVMLSLAEKAESEERIENAIGYWRMAEFFMYDGEERKLKTYQKASELFYRYYAEYFESGRVRRYQVPFKTGFLPVMAAKAEGEAKDRILLHGGNDSYYEELFFPMLYLASKGFDVYLFEGPGQGGVLRLQNMKFSPEWEAPVSAVLDYFGLEDVTIVGASLGGYLAPRAAAFDARIGRAVGWSIFPDFFQVILSDHPPVVTRLMDRLFRCRAAAGALNLFYRKMMKANELVCWNLLHGMYAYGADSPCDYIRKIREFTLKGIGERIHQDVLIIGAREDHFIHPRLFHEEYDMLKNVRSLTFKLFTDEQDAGAHCNVGNSRLVLDTIANWILEVKSPVSS